MAMMPRLRGDDDRWIYAAEAAELCGLASSAVWSRYTNGTLRRAAIAPARERRCPDTGRPQWRLSTVRNWLKSRPVGAVGLRRAEGAANHERILVAAGIGARGEAAYRAVGASLGLSAQTVRRHLEGLCRCTD